MARIKKRSYYKNLVPGLLSIAASMLTSKKPANMQENQLNNGLLPTLDLNALEDNVSLNALDGIKLVTAYTVSGPLHPESRHHALGPVSLA